MELIEKTKLSSRTLDKRLKQMINLQIIEKKTDVESGKYPVPVLYKAKPNLITYVKASIARQEVIDNMDLMLNETKDPLFLLDAIHIFSQEGFINILQRIQQHKNITNEEIYFFAEIFLWANYKQFTYKLIQASRKIINNLNINQLLMNQAKRLTEIYATLLKHHEEIEKKTHHDVPSKNAPTQ